MQCKKIFVQCREVLDFNEVSLYISNQVEWWNPFSDWLLITRDGNRTKNRMTVAWMTFDRIFIGPNILLIFLVTLFWLTWTSINLYLRSVFQSVAFALFGQMMRFNRVLHKDFENHSLIIFRNFLTPPQKSSVFLKWRYFSEVFFKMSLFPKQRHFEVTLPKITTLSKK